MNPFKVSESCEVEWLDLKLYQRGKPDPKTVIWFGVKRQRDEAIVAYTTKISLEHAGITDFGQVIRFPLLIPGMSIPGAVRPRLEPEETYELVPMPGWVCVPLLGGPDNGR